MYVPSLPAENSVKSMFKLNPEASLIEMLNKFLARIAQVPYLLYSLPLQEFITTGLITAPGASQNSVY